MSAIWPTKVRSSDVPLLRRLHGAPKLVAHVPRVWKLVRRDQEILVARERPAGPEGLRWTSVLHAGQGMTLGGANALGDTGAPVYRGQNVFPTGLVETGVRRWNGVASIRMRRFHLYDALVDRTRLFAGRKIAQLPTMAKVDEPGAMFQDTIIALQLSTALPLHVWVLGRPVQWYAAKLVRSGIIEDLAASWHKRQYLSLPVPPPEHADYHQLEDAGRALLAADLDLADGRRHVDDALRGSDRTPLGKLVANSHPATADFALAHPLNQPVKIVEIRENGDHIIGGGGELDIIVPHADLRRFLAYELRAAAERGEAVALEDIVGIRVPKELESVVQAIDEFEQADRQEAFDGAHARLDEVVGEMLGLTPDEVTAISNAMRSEAFLREIKPNYAHRGFREQQLREGGENPYR